MKFQKILISILAVVGITACSLNQLAGEKPEKQAASGSAPVEPKSAGHGKHRHIPLPLGDISVDILRQGDTLHLVRGENKDNTVSIYYQYSADWGVHWSEPVKTNALHPVKPNVTVGNDARIGVQGDNIVIVWMSTVEGNMHNAGPMHVARSADAGKTWQVGASPSNWTPGPHAFFDLAGDDNAIRVVWLDSRFGRSKISGSQGLRYSYSQDGGLSWSENQTLDDITCACCWNTIKAGANGDAYVLYRDKLPTDMAVGRIDSQHQWVRHSTVGEFNWDFPGCPHIGGGLDVTTKSQNTELHAIVGTGHPQHAGLHYLRSLDGGQTWTDPERMGDDSALHGDVASDGSGRVVAVWDMLPKDEDELSIFMSESNDGGITWSESKRLTEPGIRASHPRLVSSKKGFYAVWTQISEKRPQKMVGLTI